METNTANTGANGNVAPVSFFTQLFNAAKAFVQSIFGKVESDVEPIEHSIVKFGTAVVNEIKVLQANPTVDLAENFFVNIAETISPALKPLIAGIENEFPKILGAATNTISEVEKPVNEQIGDGLTALQNIKSINGTVYAGILGAINAGIQNYVISNNATTMPPVSADQLLVAAHIVHAQAA